MAIPDQLQMLISAFIFGSLFQAAIAAVLLFLRGCGLKVVQDRRRLVLVIFLATAALWAQVDFINYAVPPSSEGVCQGTVVVSTLLDQAGRTVIGGFLLWSVGHVWKSKSETYGLGALVGTRAVLGLVFVGYTRPQFAPVCVAQSDMLSVSAVVIALDVIVIGILTIRIFTLGLIETIRDVRSTTKQEQSKALVYCTAGFFLWTITSSAMLLGIESIILLIRTALPAIGLMVLIILMTMYSGALVLPREQDLVVPEARSPFVAIQSRSMESTNDRNGSPISSTGYRETGKLFVVNKCSMLSSASNTIFQCDGKTDSRGSAKFASTSNSGIENRSGYSSRVYDGLPMAAGAIISATPAKAAMDQSRDHYSKKMTIAERRQKRTLLERVKRRGKERIPKLAISGPMTEDMKPLSRVRTVELATAAWSERAQREEATSRRLVATRAAPPPPVMSTSEALRKLSVTKRKEVSRLASLSKQSVAEGITGSGSSLDVNATSTSASLSPGIQDVRRRSPRTLKGLERDLGPKVKKLPEIPREHSPRSASNQQAVFFVEDIEYDKPSIVKTVIKGAAHNSIKQALRREEYLDDSPVSPKSMPSIMHRPRPQRRNSEQYRTFLGSPPSPDHKPTRIGSSRRSETPLSATNPGKSTDYPVLSSPHKPPTSAAGLRRLLPNDTQTKTTCERISLLFPAPPGEPNNRRRSSVPSLPRIPSSILGSDPLSNILTGQDLQNQRSSRRTTISFGACPVKDIAVQKARTSVIKDFPVFEPISNSFPEVSPGNQETPMATGKESSTTSSQERSAFSVSDFDGDEYQDALKSAHASLHSPIPAVNITTAMQTARETFIQMRKVPTVNGKSSTQISSTLRKEVDANSTSDDEGFMTVMLGMGAVELTEASARRAFLMDASPGILSQKELEPQVSGTWHRRIGDELPTFSERRKNSTSQSTPPPPPLQLSSNGRIATVVSREPMIDEEVDTPGKAVRAIQAQLNKLDGPDRGSLEVLSRYAPHDSSRSFNTNNDDPLGLLANLEEEMGQQETLWMQMQQNFNRDSNSVIITPYHNELKSLPSPPSEASSQRSSPRSNRKLRIRSIVSRKSRSDNSVATPSTQTSENSGASAWQRRLAEAQLDFAENKSALVGRQFVNFLSMSKINVGSPTPPDSLDSGSDEEAYHNESHGSTRSPVKAHRVELLWTPKPSPPAIMIGHLWSEVPGYRRAIAVSFEPAALVPTRLPRRNSPPSSITSSGLWSKPVLNENKSGISGLWGSRKKRPRSIATRPKTQRPERKSRPLTFLPDIIEDPSPLPHTRDTLGIFRFPWGEKSDSAVYEQVPLPPCANFQDFAFCQYLETKPLPVPPELEEIEDYSSAYFSEYGEFYADGLDETSDDDFDEATLWEIANLLHSQDVRSRNSLLPSPRIIEDYDDDHLEDEMTESIQGYKQVIQAPPQSHFVTAQPLGPETPPLAQLWVKPSEPTASRLEIGIDQPETPTWQAYLSPINEPVRAKPSKGLSQASVPSITSRNLWDSERRAFSSQPARGKINLWNQQVVIEDEDLSLPDRENRPSRNNSVSGLDISTALQPNETPLKPASLHRASIRGSRVLTSCDFWESKVEGPALGHAAKKSA